MAPKQPIFTAGAAAAVITDALEENIDVYFVAAAKPPIADMPAEQAEQAEEETKLAEAMHENCLLKEAWRARLKQNMKQKIKQKSRS